MLLFDACYKYKTGQVFGSTICAESHEAAQDMATKRGIGEIVNGVINHGAIHRPVFMLLRDRTANPLEIAHLAVFHGWLAASAGVIDAKDAMSDIGIVHDTMHVIRAFPGTSRANLAKKWQRLERKIPGVWTGQPIAVPIRVRVRA